jgi:hypothetical protein
MCDETSNIAGMRLMTLCKFEYDDDACFTAWQPTTAKMTMEEKGPSLTPM